MVVEKREERRRRRRKRRKKKSRVSVYFAEKVHVLGAFVRWLVGEKMFVR
jgi:hypothetical protein